MLIPIAFVAGMIAGISPCILPILPIVLVAGATRSSDEGTGSSASSKPRWWKRPDLRHSLSIVAGLVTSFTLLVLLSAEVLSLFHLPQGLLRWLGITMLIVLGAGMLIPAVGDFIERPFRRFGQQPISKSGGFVVGLALGLVFVPCAGPILATITVLGARNQISPMVGLVALAFGAGVAVPLVFIATAGDQLVARSRRLRGRGRLLRVVGGTTILLLSLGLATNSFAGLQRAVPGYTAALQRTIEDAPTVRQQLNQLKGVASTSLSSCPSDSVTLENCGKAPEFANVTAWLQTPNEKPLSLVGLRGHVVLVDFWTYTCINCQRTLPHVEAWYQRYHPAGLEVIGVHTPEFSFEHDVGNVQQAAGALGVEYPIAVDNAYGTWDAYSNEYWPAEYLIDATGHVRHVSFGEGNYQVTERQIRELLIDARPGISLPPSSNLPDTQPVTQTNPETYLGTTRLQYLDPSQTPSLTPTIYQMPRTISVPTFGLGGTWSFTNEAALAGSHASLNLPFTASDVFLVMGGEGTVRVSGPMGTSTIHVHGIPTLYTLARAPQPMSGVLSLTFTPGIKAYDFTFG